MQINFEEYVAKFRRFIEEVETESREIMKK